MQDLTPPTVLIIEDDPIASHIYRSRLEKEGYKVEVAADGQAGFYRLHGLRPDAVLLDLMLPKMKGVDILKKIRAQPGFHDLPVLVFTNAFVPAMIQSASEAGATAVYSKCNLSAQQIVDAVQKHLPRVRPDLPEPSTRAFAPPLAPFQASPLVPAAPPLGQAVPAAAEVHPPSIAAPDLSARQTLLPHVAQLLAELRQQLRDCAAATTDDARRGPLQELRRLAAALGEQTATAKSSSLHHLISVLELFLRELNERPDPALPSRLRTIASALDVLQDWCATGAPPEPPNQAPFEILVVDDEPLSRRALSFALQRPCLKSECVESPSAALALAAHRAFDTVILDIRLPEMDGFKLCEAIRACGPNPNVPVIFVTSCADFRNRAQSTLAGGNDFVAKPFLFAEMTTKVLACCLRGRLERHKNRPG